MVLIKPSKAVSRSRRTGRTIEGLDGLPDVTAKQLAQLFMIDQATFSILHQRGVIKSIRQKKATAGRAAELFDLIDCVQDYCFAMRNTRKTDPDDKIKAARAREVEVRTAQREGKLVDLEEAIVLSDSLVGTFRTRMAGLSSQVTRDLKTRIAIDKAVDEVLTQLANEYQSKVDSLKEGESLVDAEASDDEDELEEDDAA